MEGIGDRENRPWNRDMFWAQDATTHLPWAREVPFQAVHSVSRFFSFSNNLGNLLFARRTTPMAVSDRVLIRF